MVAIGLLALVGAAMAPAIDCARVTGADALWASPRTRWVLIGDMHGTNEIPDAFLNLICLAARARGPVTVALEYPAETQPLIDAWMASNGGDAAKVALMKASDWHDPYQSGRTSVAVLRMFERLRVLKRKGVVRAVRVFDVPIAGPTGFERNESMAKNLISIVKETRALTLVLVGNVHAARYPFMVGPEEYRPAAFFLPEEQRVTVVMTAPGGSSWGCRREGCHIYNDPVVASRSAGVFPDTGPEHRYDFRYDLGSPTTAAEPAIPGIAITTP